jgi:hypothetical protein
MIGLNHGVKKMAYKNGDEFLEKGAAKLQMSNLILEQ